MSIWQYKIVEAGSWQVYRVDRQPVLSSSSGYQLSQQPPQPQTPLPVLDTAYLDALGADGWELVSYDVDHEHVGLMTTLIFKRPKH